MMPGEPVKFQWPETAPTDYVQFAMVTRDSAGWLPPVLQAVARLEQYRPNWDGYGSPRIGPAALLSVRHFLKSISAFELPAPNVFPVSGGGIGLQFRKADRELEIEVLPNGSLNILRDEGDLDAAVEASLPGLFQLGWIYFAGNLAQWLIGGEQA